MSRQDLEYNQTIEWLQGKTNHFLGYNSEDQLSRGSERVRLYLHSPFRFMASRLIKYSDKF